MKARLGFSIATHLEPDILIVDEVLAVGDLAFRRKCVKHIQGFRERGGSMVLVAHDPYLIQTVCTRVIVMEKGRAIFDGPAIEGVDLHFQLGHAATLHDAAGKDSPGDFDGQTVERNWLSEPVADVRQQPTGEHPIVVDGLEVSAEDGGSLMTGCCVIVTLRCRSQIAGEVGWGFTLCTADLTTSISSLAIGLDGRSVAIRPGENEFRCRIPNLPLRPGVYAIRGGVSDAATRMAIALLGHHDAPAFFTVTSDQPDRTGNMRSLLHDLVEIPVEWL
jgi:hypothetical protein